MDDSQQVASDQRDTRWTSALGGWLFRHRTIVPLPFALIILLVPGDETQPALLTLAGVVLVLAGELLRLWGVHHIGVISRTRSDRLGPLISSGPFAFVRNPLYLGNIALWTGFAVCARLLWLAPVITLILALEYQAIVRWEEQLLGARLGERYREYQRQVPRWLPGFRAAANRSPSEDGRDLRWSETFFSERGTLVAIAAGFLLLWLKARS